jgi:hypothetical protein
MGLDKEGDSKNKEARHVSKALVKVCMIPNAHCLFEDSQLFLHALSTHTSLQSALTGTNFSAYRPECRPSVSMPLALQKSDRNAKTTVAGTAAPCTSLMCVYCHQPQKTNGGIKMRA